MRRDVGAGLRHCHRDLAAPFDVFAKPSSESFVVWESGLVGRLEEDLDEPLALWFGDRTIRVVAEERRMAAQLARVRIGPTEDLPQPGREVLDVSWPALTTEYLNENRVGQAAAILRFGESPKRISAPEVLKDRRFPHHALTRSHRVFRRQSNTAGPLP
jgi:hypothetical protein